MGKPDVAPQRFRRKARSQEPAGGGDKLSNSSFSSHSTVDSLLDSSPTPLVEEVGLSTASPLGEGLATLEPLEDGPTIVEPLREEPTFGGPQGQQLVAPSLLGEEPNTTSLLGEGQTNDSVLGEGPNHTGSQWEGGRESPPPLCDLEDTLGYQAGDEGEDEPPVRGEGAADPGRQAPPGLPTEPPELPHSQLLSLASDRCLALSAWKVYGEEALELRLLLHNSSGSSLRGLAVQLRSHQLKVLQELPLKGLLHS